MSEHGTQDYEHVWPPHNQVARAEAALAELQELYRDRERDLAFEHARAEAAEAALAAMQDELASMTVRMQIAEDGRKIETRRAERALDDLWTAKRKLQLCDPI